MIKMKMKMGDRKWVRHNTNGILLGLFGGGSDGGGDGGGGGGGGGCGGGDGGELIMIDADSEVSLYADCQS